METPGVNGIERMQLRGYVVRIRKRNRKRPNRRRVVFTD